MIKPAPLADFTIRLHVWRVLLLSIPVGAVSAGVALGLLDLIGLFTHLFYYGNAGHTLVAPTVHRWGWLTLFIPVGGGLVIGAMAYWGSERIRGHGIPEAMESILVGGSRVEPRLTVLKPIASAIGIGSGGPFGAEGPIILTGGAFGSLVAQSFRLSAYERRTLLVAGSCGGMAAVFGTPVAAVLFGVELLVFELRPRSSVPIAISVVTASTVRSILTDHHLMSTVPLFPVPPHGSFAALGILAACGVGVAGGVLSWVMTTAVYGAEDLFHKLPIHWAWWPAIGGVVVGIGGLVEPRALGVGYNTIDAALGGRLALGTLGAILVVKTVIWSVGLGSGTSGGVVAPILIAGSAMGGLLAPVLPGNAAGTWALIGMAAAFAGVTRSPLTAIVFGFELTHDVGSLLPLLAACAVAHLVSTLVLKRSILTEKVARRGFHVSREYTVEPLEALYVREAMLTDVLTVTPEQAICELESLVLSNTDYRRQRLYPVATDDGRLVGIISGTDLVVATATGRGQISATELARPRESLVVAYPTETLRSAADRMAEHSLGALPVVDPDEPDQLLGVLTEFDLLKARQRELEEERHRERILWLRRPDSGRPEVAPTPSEPTLAPARLRVDPTDGRPPA